jgi:uncharacterized protein (TIGR03435 family)
MRHAWIAVLLALSGGIVRAQTFQSASIHPSRTGPGMPSGRMYIGGRGSVTFTATNASLASLVIAAYELRPYQLSGPGWMESDRFDITAKEPPGTAAPQIRIMLQNLLATRFKMAVHRGTKDVSQYQLTVLPGKPLLANTAPPAAVPGETEAREPDALQTEPGAHLSMAIGQGGGRITTTGETMGQLAQLLEAPLHEPVIDATGLKGKFAFRLEWAQADAQNTLAEALKTQLGIKLEHKKRPIDILIVDHAEKHPTQN